MQHFEDKSRFGIVGGEGVVSCFRPFNTVWRGLLFLVKLIIFTHTHGPDLTPDTFYQLFPPEWPNLCQNEHIGAGQWYQSIHSEILPRFSVQNIFLALKLTKSSVT